MSIVGTTALTARKSALIVNIVEIVQMFVNYVGSIAAIVKIRLANSVMYRLVVSITHIVIYVIPAPVTPSIWSVLIVGNMYLVIGPVNL